MPHGDCVVEAISCDLNARLSLRTLDAAYSGIWHSGENRATPVPDQCPLVFQRGNVVRLNVCLRPRQGEQGSGIPSCFRQLRGKKFSCRF